MATRDPTLFEVARFVFTPDIEWSVEEVAQVLGFQQAGKTNGDGVTAPESALAPSPPAVSSPERRGLTQPASETSFTQPLARTRRMVSGRYRSAGATQLELRVDVDGARPTHRISGDIFFASGATVSYFGSFLVNGPAMTVTTSTVTLEGLGECTWSTASFKLRVIIQRTPSLQPPGAATAQFFTVNGAPGPSFVCPFESRFFRTLQFEEDHVQGLTPFVSYDTGELPSGGSPRVLSLANAYAEAGIEIQVAGVSNVVPDVGKWSDSELHAAMEQHFSLWGDDPQWRVWLLTAQEHESDGRTGTMFDKQGKHRQGCAVFHKAIAKAIAGDVTKEQRLQLFACVHELGHCLNLVHSFRKEFMDPPEPNRLDALSWMNYPEEYQPFPQRPGRFGEFIEAFWAAFPFQFDNLELIHLRHAFRKNVIPGANEFRTGAALQDPEVFATPFQDNSGLRLELRRRKKSFALGEPVVIELKLETTDVRGKQVNADIHPNMGFVQVGIRRPDGTVLVYAPLFENCVIPEMVTLNSDRPSTYKSAYIGYGKHGPYFAQPGLYQLRAVYHAPDGSRVMSNVLELRVSSPLTQADDEVADLMLGDDQGKLFYLLGSDSPYLKTGRDELDLLLDKHGNHRLAVYPRLAKGVNEGRDFKTITPDRKLEVRRAKPSESETLLSRVVDVSVAGQGVDNITLNFAFRRLARAQQDQDHMGQAAATARAMVAHFRTTVKVPPHVMRWIEDQAAVFGYKQGGAEPSSSAEERDTDQETRTRPGKVSDLKSKEYRLSEAGEPQPPRAD